VFFFPVYAVICWVLACRFRRTWRGVGVVALGVLGLVALGWVHWRLSVITHGRVYLPIMQLLLYPYTALVAMGGVFMVSMPRRPGRGECRACGYRLAGLEAGEAGIVCPECGVGGAVRALAGVGPSAEDRAVQHAQAEDHQRDAREEHDPEEHDRAVFERLHERRALCRGAAGDQLVLTREPGHP
jgi:hypothetical protein